MVCVCVIPQTDVAFESKVTTDLRQRKDENILPPKAVTTGQKTSGSQSVTNTDEFSHTPCPNKCRSWRLLFGHEDKLRARETR